MVENKELIKIICEYFDNQYVDYEKKEDVILTGFEIDNLLNSINICIYFNEHGVTIYGLVEDYVSENSRNMVMEYITRANYGLRLGNFELDLEDGEIRYKVYTNTKGMTELPQEIVEDAIIVPAMMFDRYGDGLATLMMGFSDPVTEIEKAEKEDE